ncbi:autotransporter [Mesorhizobium sp. BAC0120]|uniref:beta strand repeat-containing protein n=1 Tax=Mesorhizobium sp. BAC0120 TaxID=3090670 RepID=UPI00298C1B6F|nr:autotransporter [Mesorhizobium sp. BAC0120]MDW6024107.1 autotransporter [Mesorhizobium sp. BAC0120]
MLNKCAKPRHLGTVSALALIAAGCLISSPAAACEATASGTTQITSVDVGCFLNTSGLTAPFATSIVTVGPGDPAAYAGDGGDTITINGETISATGVEVVPVTTPFGGRTLTQSAGSIQTLGGADRFTFIRGEIGSPTGRVDVDLGDGNDAFTIGGSGTDAILYGAVIGGAGNDEITVDTGGTVIFGIDAGAGDDNVHVLGGTIGAVDAPATVALGPGNNTFTMSGGTIYGSVLGGPDRDTFEVSGNALITGVAGVSAAIETGGGSNNSVRILGGTIGTDPSVMAVFLEGTANTLQMTGGTVNGNIVGQGGGNTYTIGGGTINGSLFAGSGNDQIAISGGVINGDVEGDNGIDVITISGGSISGNVTGETIRLYGGTIGGNLTGIGPDTLVINDSLSPNPISLTNGVVFSGTSANAFITNTDLARGGSSFQVFSGFDNVQANASTLGFSTGAIGIDALTLLNGSTLFINGNVIMPSGTVNVTNSTISMINGVTGDVLTLGGITLNNATLGFDVNQQTLQADHIVAGAFSAAGTNTILVNLLGTPQFSQATDIPIIITNSPIVGNFVIAGASSIVIPGAPGAPGTVFVYQLVFGPGGDLLLRATPIGAQFALAPQNAIDVATVDTALDALDGINNDAIMYNLGLINGVQASALTDTLTVFASGQLAHTEHSGFDISSGGLTGVGPSFGVHEFSAAVNLDFNAAKAFELDQQYGLNFGVFGGYAQADVDNGGFQSFTDSGSSTNRSGMFGSYGLFRQNANYALVSALAFIGSTDTTNDLLGTTGEYDTQGYAATASVGHIFVLNERLRFDMRGGLLGVTFTGGDYVDSGGTQFGESRISFGAVKLEPGIYADYRLENSMTFSPYVRTELQQRFGYTNKASIDGVRVDFEDADFSAALYGGFNLKMSERSTLSTEIRGKWSSDSTTLAGKLGLKVAF